MLEVGGKPPKIDGLENILAVLHGIPSVWLLGQIAVLLPKYLMKISSQLVLANITLTCLVSSYFWTGPFEMTLQYVSARMVGGALTSNCTC